MASTAPLDVLHVFAPARFGGLERVVEMLATAQLRKGARVGVLAFVGRGEDHPLVRSLENSGLPIYPVRLRARAYRAARRELRAHCERLSPAVVHTHGYFSDVLAIGVIRRSGAGSVTTLHGFTGGGVKNRFYQFMQLRAARRFDAVVAVSRHMVGRLQRAGIEEGRIAHVQNAWEPSGELLLKAEARERLDLSSDSTVVGWVGRLSEEKGADLFLSAAAKLDQPHLSFSILGTGAADGELRRYAKTMRLAGQTRFHGYVPDAERLLGAFDVFVNSSRTEGTPMIVLGAMAAEVPIVATSVGGVPEMLSEDEALLVPPNDPTAIAEAICATLDNPTATSARVKAARARLARDFAIQPWVDRYDRIYRAVRDRSR